jgi:NAD(P)-dependent dehydrogenase (short-subunit alcohol dehydrogenase family)
LLILVCDLGKAGGLYGRTPVKDLSTEELRQYMNVNFESNFFAYRATIPYLLEQNHPNSTWTLCTGVMGDFGMHAAPALTQGALYSLANVACRDNKETNVRFNEVYLSLRVEVDESAEKKGFFKASTFAETFQEILTRPEIQSSRISVFEKQDMKELKFKEKRLELVLKKDT